MDDPGNVFKFVRFHELEAAKKLNGVGHAYSMNDSTVDCADCDQLQLIQRSVCLVIRSFTDSVAARTICTIHQLRKVQTRHQPH